MFKQTYSGVPIISQRAMNELARVGCRQAVEYWLLHFLPLHFEPLARTRYTHAPRSPNWERIKQRAKRVRYPRGSENWIPAVRPPRDLVWTQELRREVIGMRAALVSRIDARATASRIHASVTIPLPHPLSNRYAPEIVRLIPEEIDAMQAIVDRAVGAGLPAALKAAPRQAA